MKDSSIGKQISEFLEESASLKRKHHILMLHEEQEYGRAIEYCFLKIGLEKGERSVYVVLEKDDKSVIEREMKDFGIDVKRHTKENLLHIIQVPNPLEHPDGVAAGIQTALQKALSNISPPFRLTDRLFSIQVNRFEPGILKNILDVEEAFHQAFQGQNISAEYLCSYPVDSINDLLEDKWDWAEGMLQNHQGAIYATSFSKGLALRLD